MVLGLALLRDSNIERLLADPPRIWQLLAPDEPECYEQARAASAPNGGLLRRWFGAPHPPPPAGLPLELGPHEGLAPGLDKSWHGLHFLLTGTAEDGSPPLNFLLAGGQYVGTIDVGYGPARVFSATETQRIHAALAALPDAVVQARFAPTALIKANVYPPMWDRPPEANDALGYLLEYLATLRGVLATAAAAGTGLVVYLT